MNLRDFQADGICLPQRPSFAPTQFVHCAGKSTLIKSVSGVYQADGGAILIYPGRMRVLSCGLS